MSAESTASSPSSNEMDQAEGSRNRPLKSLTIWYTGETPAKLDLGKGDFSVLGVWHGAWQPTPSAGEDNPAACEVCSINFSTSHQQHVHAKCHREGQEQMQVCTVCSALLKDYDSFQSHVKSHDNEDDSREKKARESLINEESLLMDVEACEEEDGSLHDSSRTGGSFMLGNELPHQQSQVKSKVHKCKICSQEFGTGDALQKHEEMHCREQMLACPLCGEIFSGVGLLESHLKSHSASQYSCHQCSMVCASLEVLQNHLLFHKGRHPFVCQACGLAFPKSSLLQEHLEIHNSETRLHHEHREETYLLHTADRRMSSNSEHSASIADSMPVLREMLNQKRLGGHESRETFGLHKAPEQVPQTPPSFGAGVEVLMIQGDLQCKQCGKALESSKLLQEHLLSHRDDQLLLCPECGEVFSDKEKLLQHSKTHRWDLGGSAFHTSGSRQSSRRRNSARNRATQRLSVKAEKVSLPPELHCAQCNLSFSQAAQLQRHMKAHASEQDLPDRTSGGSPLNATQLSAPTDTRDQKEGDHVCEACGRSFAAKELLVEHMKSHDSEFPYQCTACGMAFKHRSRLMNHISKHSEPKFECKVCGKMFRRAGSLKDHTRTHTGEKPYECYVCGMWFAQRGSLKLHAEKHPEPLNKACSECGVVLDYFRELVDHMKTHVKRTRKSSSEPNKTSTRKNPKETENFMKTNLENMPFKCADCGEGFLYRGSLLKHRVIHVGKYHCFKCGKRFISQARLESHANIHRMRTRIREKSKCEDCGRVFSNKPNMERHRKIHTGEKPFSCELCGKRFIQSGNLTYHLRTHSGEMTHQCDRCGKSFNSSSKLLVHMRVHTGVRPFKCKECGKAFKQSHQLKCHLRMHTGERPFSCSECSKTFSRLGNLQLHLKMHRGEKSHVCKHCGKGFVQSSNLKVHLRTHTGKEAELTGGLERAMEFGQSLHNQQGWQYMW